MHTTNRQIVLAKTITGQPSATDFRLVEFDAPAINDGEFLIRHIYLSLDPYQRGAIAGTHMSADGALSAGQMPSAETIGQVVASRNPRFREGDYVRHFGGWQEFSKSNGDRTFKLDPAQAPLSTYLGILGMPGLTAYASMIKLANVQSGQHVLVSAATGPVGSMVGQIAMQRGAIAHGVAGSDEKCRYAQEKLGFASCTNYRQPGFAEALRNTVSDIDVYHDNVGGQMLTDALSVLRTYGTVILCGLISQYNEANKGQNFNLAPVIIRRAVMKGLVVYDFEADRPEFVEQVSTWLRDGHIRYREDRAAGIEQTPTHFERLMSGQNFGKSLVVLGPESL